MAAVKALLNGRGLYGEQTSPVPPELGLIGGVIANTACLHRVKHGKRPTEFLNNSSAPKGHTQGQRAHPGSDLRALTWLEQRQSGTQRRKAEHPAQYEHCGDNATQRQAP